MAKIKTKEAIKGTIKQLDRVAIASDRMKRAFIQTKEKAETSTNAPEGSIEEYAATRMEGGVQTITHEAVHQADKVGRNSISNARDDIKEAKQAVENFRSVRSEQSSRRKTIKTRYAVDGKQEEPANPSQEPQSSVRRSVRQAEPSRGTKPSVSGDDPKRAVEQGRKRAVQISQAKRQEAVVCSRTPSRHHIRTTEQPAKQIKESARSAGKKSVKTTQKAAAKTTRKSVKTAEHTAKKAVKTSKETAKTAEKNARAPAKAAQKTAHAAKVTAKSAAQGMRDTVKVTVATVKTIIAATKALISAIIAGGWVTLLVIVVICMIGLFVGSIFGIFFSGEDSGTGMSMRTVVQEINAEYDARLEEEKDSVSYDSLEMSGGRAVWKDVLAVYAVKVNTDPDNSQEVVTMDDSKKQLLTDIFWEMHSISSHTETSTTTVTTETDDGEGNIIETETTETYTTLYIIVSHKTVDEMAVQYGFSQEQKECLAELLQDENNSLWSAVLYGIGFSDDQIVNVALSQLGNYGGTPYWSWYGFGARVEWCACFVSWCANECGYIETGVIPKYAGCVFGVQWFKDRGQWMDNSAEPSPGMIIFFDWDNRGSSGPQDGVSDHTGIVQKVENGYVYTVEGNSSDSVKINSYPVGHYEIYGYGVPQY